MITPGTRQKIAKIVFAYTNAPVKPIEPIPSPMSAGWMLKRQAS